MIKKLILKFFGGLATLLGSFLMTLIVMPIFGLVFIVLIGMAFFNLGIYLFFKE